MAKICACGERIGLGCKDMCWRCKQKRDLLKREQDAAGNGKVLLHSCLSNQFDPVRGSCTCKKLVDHKSAEDLIDGNAAVDYETRSKIFCGRSILLIHKLKLAPRVRTIDRANIEQGLIDGAKSIDQLKKYNVAELQRRVAEDKADRSEEERCRWDIYHEITLAEFFSTAPRTLPDGRVLSPLIVEVDAVEFEHRRDEDYGRPGIFVNIDQRTEGGIGRDVPVSAEPQYAAAKAA